MRVGAAAAELQSRIVQVIVVRATSAGFAATVRVIGFLVVRQEAMVTLDVPGLKVTEVW